jgi:type VI secretion system FHA domain protein
MTNVAPSLTGGEAELLKQAFLRGAGIAPEAISAELTPEMMELVGKLLASSLQGAIDLLALRSLVKQEVNADVTMVVVRGNNPLKFFDDSQTVLTQMLRKKMPGFMEPIESVNDAWHDLRGHQRGVAAGSRASMDAMLSRLAPTRLEAALPAAGMIDGLLPARRKAALWEQYTGAYSQLAGESTDAFTSVFGSAFLAAYEQEVARFDKAHGHE